MITEFAINNFLEKVNYKLIDKLREIHGCYWYLVRDKATSELIEIELYDKAIYNIDLIDNYITDSTSIISRNEEFAHPRFPIQILDEENFVCIFRKYIAGEPLYISLFRPGHIPYMSALKIYLSLCGSLKNSLKNDISKFTPLFPCFYKSDNGNETTEIFLDNIQCGPWIEKFESKNMFFPYINTNATPERQACFFANKTLLKLITGKHTPEANWQSQLNTEDWPKWLIKMLDDLVKFPTHVEETWQDSIITSHISTKKIPFKKYALITTVILSLIFAVKWKEIQSRGHWLGESDGGDSGLEDIEAPMEQFDFSVSKGGNKILLSPMFKIKIDYIDLYMNSGEFLNAKELLNLLSNKKLRKAETKILKKYIILYEKRLKRDYLISEERAQFLYENAAYDRAIETMVFILKNYPPGAQVNKSKIIIKKMLSKRTEDKIRKELKVKKFKAQLFNDRELVKNIDLYRQFKNIYKSPAKKMSRLDKKIRLKRLDIQGNAGKYLLSCYKKINFGENFLFKKFLGKVSEKPSSKILDIIREILIIPIDEHITTISKDGIGFSKDTTIGTHKYSSFVPEQLYTLYNKLLEIDSNKKSYNLYLFCISRGLTKEAAIDKGKIKNKSYLRQIDVLRDIKMAHRDLYNKGEK